MKSLDRSPTDSNRSSLGVLALTRVAWLHRVRHCLNKASRVFTAVICRQTRKQTRDIRYCVCGVLHEVFFLHSIVPVFPLLILLITRSSSCLDIPQCRTLGLWCVIWIILGIWGIRSQFPSRISQTNSVFTIVVTVDPKICAISIVDVLDPKYAILI